MKIAIDCVHYNPETRQTIPYEMVCTFEDGTLNLDDVLGNKDIGAERLNDIPDDEIESERGDAERFLNRWDHPRSTHEDNIFAEEMKEMGIKIVE